MSAFGWVALAVTILLPLAAWKFAGLGKGKAFGNKIADALGWKRSFFHSALDIGAGNTSLLLLKGLEEAGFSPEQAAVALAPNIMFGLNSLDERFGPQEMIEDAKPVAERLLQEYQELQQRNQTSSTR
jgi:hypothetical protein